jgi:secreted trypsin-like serine protease
MRGAAFAAALVALTACGGSAIDTSTSPSPTTPTLPVSQACSAITTSSTTSAVTPQVVNGSDCTGANSPVVLLNMKDSGGQQLASCSGTVVSSHGIVTAAHCLEGGVGSVLVFRGTGAQLPSASFAAWPNYSQNDPNSRDVGVVITADPIGITPTPILTSRDGRVGETAVIAGWGKDQNGVLSTLRAGVAILSAVDSTSLQTQFTSNLSSVCQGDSGGPLLLQQDGVWSEAGVISANSTLACSFGANFYTSIRNSDVTNFIVSHIPDAARR